MITHERLLFYNFSFENGKGIHVFKYSFLVEPKTHLFAVLLEVILRKYGCIFYYTYFLLYSLAGKGITYHVVAHDLKF